MHVELTELAEVSARLDAGERRERLFEEKGIDPEHWLASQATWLRKIEAGVRRGDYRLQQRYAKLYSDWAARLRAVCPTAFEKAPPAPAVHSARQVEARAQVHAGVQQVQAVSLSLEQFSCIMAELAAFPADQQRIHERAGISSEGLERERVRFANEFSRSADLAARGEQLYAYYHELFRQG